jgi:hypothetical protein
MRPPFFGEKKNDVRTSETPEAGAPPSKRGGWLTNGTMTRAIRFQSALSENGITG